MSEKRRIENRETAIMRKYGKGASGEATRDVSRERIHMLIGMVLAMVILAVLVMAANSGGAGPGRHHALTGDAA